VIVAQGAMFGGWSLYAKDGKPKYCYNLVGVEYTYVEGRGALPLGKHQIRVELEYDGGGPRKGGDLALFVDGKAVGTGRLEKTQAFLFSPDETCDVGNDTGTPVSQDYGPHGSAFNGEVNWMQIDVDENAKDADHMVSSEEGVRIAMVRQ
jgi:arylsulfatase